MIAQELIKRMKASIPVNATIYLYKNRLLCELSDEDYDNHLTEVIKSLQFCFDPQENAALQGQYVRLYSMHSKKVSLIKLWTTELHRRLTRV